MDLLISGTRALLGLMTETDVEVAQIWLKNELKDVHELSDRASDFSRHDVEYMINRLQTIRDVMYWIEQNKQ